MARKLALFYQRGKYLISSVFGTSDQLESEYRMGMLLAEEVRENFTIAEDTKGLLLVESLAGRLKTRVRNKKRIFHFDLIQSPDLNAFALPGGFVFLTTGLVRMLQSHQDALAFVLAHEMSHILLRHPLHRMLRGHSLQFLNRLLRSDNLFAGFLKESLSVMVQNKYSQQEELEADRIACLWIHSAGFSPQGGKILFQNMMSRFRSEEGMIPYFNSHPSLKERLDWQDKCLPR